MSYIVDNAIIISAGFSSRFVPISHTKPKALAEVKGEILIERMILQLRSAGIQEIVVVVGYKKECYYYLKDKYDVIIVENNEYQTRNNHSSLYAAKNYLKNSYVCASDLYFLCNPFQNKVDFPFYGVEHSTGATKEWCVSCDDNNFINKVVVGGNDALFMLDFAFFSKAFSDKFLDFIVSEYDLEITKNKYWETIYAEHLDVLQLKANLYKNTVYEFDSLDELRIFDTSYIDDTRSKEIKNISKHFNCKEKEISSFEFLNNSAFTFKFGGTTYIYTYTNGKIKQL